jgi:hypothetical protein
MLREKQKREEEIKGKGEEKIELPSAIASELALTVIIKLGTGGVATLPPLQHCI